MHQLEKLILLIERELEIVLKNKELIVHEHLKMALNLLTHQILM
jgi:hypothetical protein